MVSPPVPPFTAATASRSEQVVMVVQPPALFVSAVVLTVYVMALATDAPPSASGTDIASAMSPRYARPLNILASLPELRVPRGPLPGPTRRRNAARQGGAQAHVAQSPGVTDMSLQELYKWRGPESNRRHHDFQGPVPGGVGHTKALQT